jgi:phage baseplate assembly protein W
MAIKLTNFERIAKNYTQQQYIYKDLALDIQENIIVSTGFARSINGTDIKASFDVAAIRNSLQNLFNTLPGQRFLFPEYGLDLYQFLFQPVTLDNANLIGNAILQKIRTFESRVVVRKVNVTARPDQNAYEIKIIIEIPILQLTTELPAVIDVKKQSFIFVPTSRNK